MTNEIKILENIEFGELRTIVDMNGNIMFCANDVATALGYRNPKDAIANHCKKDGATFWIC